MKPKMITFLLTLFLCILTGCGTKSDINTNAKIPIMNSEAEPAANEKNSTSSNTSTDSVDTNTTKPVIKAEKAKKIALDHAKLQNNEITFHKVELDQDDGVPYFEIKFTANGKEYEYEIEAVTGKIISWDQEHQEKNDEYDD